MIRILESSPLTGSSDYRGLVRQQYILNSARNTINVTIINDNVFEQTELFHVSLNLSGSGSPRVSLGVNSAQVTILDDDGQFNDSNSMAHAWHGILVLVPAHVMHGCIHNSTTVYH